MTVKFLDSLGSQLAQHWIANLITPAFFFWLGGALAWIDRWGWNTFQTTVLNVDEGLRVLLLVAGLLLVLASGFIVQRFDLTILRLFEGYWPRWMSPLHRWLLKHHRAQFTQREQQWQALKLKQETQALTSAEHRELLAIDRQLRQMPTRPERLMPTRFGNLLRAAESLPELKYGLDAVICWPRLWMVLPDHVKQELQQVRSELNLAAQNWLWSFLFLVWGLWAWWAFVVGVVGMGLTYSWMLQAAEQYGDSIESTFDLFRLKLYQGLHWPLPKSPEEEVQLGRSLTEYLWRGNSQAISNFVYSDEPSDP